MLVFIRGFHWVSCCVKAKLMQNLFKVCSEHVLTCFNTTRTPFHITDLEDRHILIIPPRRINDGLFYFHCIFVSFPWHMKLKRVEHFIGICSNAGYLDNFYMKIQFYIK